MRAISSHSLLTEACALKLKAGSKLKKYKYKLPLLNIKIDSLKFEEEL